MVINALIKLTNPYFYVLMHYNNVIILYYDYKILIKITKCLDYLDFLIRISLMIDIYSSIRCLYNMFNVFITLYLFQINKKNLLVFKSEPVIPWYKFYRSRYKYVIIQFQCFYIIWNCLFESEAELTLLDIYINNLLIV